MGAENGSIILKGGKISLVGSSGGSSDGTLTLRAPRIGEMDVNIQQKPGTTVDVDTHKPIIVEGFKTYLAGKLNGMPDDDCGTGGSCDVADMTGALFMDAAQFVGNIPGISSRLATGFTNDFGTSSPVQIQVRPGIEIDSTGDLTLGGGRYPDGVGPQQLERGTG